MANGEEDTMGSLFEGMVLFNSSQVPDSNDPSPPSSSAPLDENLFSDLTLITPPHSLTPQPPSDPSPTTTTTASTPEIASGTRQVSRRKKKGGFRIGYGRDASILVDEPISSSSQSLPDSRLQQSPIKSDSDFKFEEPPVASRVELVSQSSAIETEVPEQSSEIPRIESEVLEKSSEIPRIESEALEKGSTAIPTIEINVQEKASVENDEIRDGLVAGTVPESDKGDSSSSEEKLEQIRARISENIERIRRMVSDVSVSRKEAARKRRKAAENVNLASVKYKELERELEEACEAEDFEKADRVSESLAAVEKEKESFANALREAEADCDAVDMKMQEVLELQIAAEEEGVLLLEQFAKVTIQYIPL